MPKCIDQLLSSMCSKIDSSCLFPTFNSFRFHYVIIVAVCQYWRKSINGTTIIWRLQRDPIWSKWCNFTMISHTFVHLYVIVQTVVQINHRRCEDHGWSRLTTKELLFNINFHALLMSVINKLLQNVNIQTGTHTHTHTHTHK